MIQLLSNLPNFAAPRVTKLHLFRHTRISTAYPQLRSFSFGQIFKSHSSSSYLQLSKFPSRSTRFYTTPATPPPPATQSKVQMYLSKFANGTQPGTLQFYKEVFIIFTVFGVTGSSSMWFVRRLVKMLCGEGSLAEGPNAYRLTYLMTSLPMYSLILLTLGNLSGRGRYFNNVILRMWGRVLPTNVKSRLNS